MNPMIIDNPLKELYLDWLTSLVMFNCPNYTKLLKHLFICNFIPPLSEDENRGKDGLDLRDHFALVSNVSKEDAEEYFGCNPCSMLEMMVALSIRMENVMADDAFGDRTDYWFKNMLVNLELNGQDDEHYSGSYVESRLINYFEGNYLPNGEGGLFTLPEYIGDVRELEIWYQMQYYLNYVDQTTEHYEI